MIENNASPVIWEDPPADGRRPHPCWDELKARPGVWARLPLYWSGVTHLRRRHRDFEIVVRQVDGEKMLYARYIGNGES